MGRIVSADREKLDLLNSIIFKYINALIDEKIKELSLCCDFILLDAPTLFEAGADSKCDVIVSVTADEKLRLKRVTKRDGIDEESVKKRFSSLHDEDFFEAHSDYIIRNNGSSAESEAQALKIINEIKEGKIGGSKR